MTFALQPTDCTPKHDTKYQRNQTKTVNVLHTVVTMSDQASVTIKQPLLEIKQCFFMNFKRKSYAEQMWSSIVRLVSA